MSVRETILKRIDFVLSNAYLALESSNEDYSGTIQIDDSLMYSFKTSGLSLLLDLYSKDHPYYLVFKSSTLYSYPSHVHNGIEIIKNVKQEVENGWALSIKSLVSAEIFNDFLEMSSHLLDSNYKDAAAVIIGSVIEEHVRQLCINNHIEITFEKDGKLIYHKADRMNSDLAKAGVYNLLEQKGVTTQLDLRNKAAHGKYSEFDKAHVQTMYDFVLNFVIRNPL